MKTKAFYFINEHSFLNFTNGKFLTLSTMFLLLTLVDKLICVYVITLNIIRENKLNAKILLEKSLFCNKSIFMIRFAVFAQKVDVQHPIK